MVGYLKGIQKEDVPTLSQSTGKSFVCSISQVYLFLRIANVSFGFRAGLLHFKPASCILRLAVLADICTPKLLSTAVMSLNCALRFSKAVYIKKRSPRTVVFLERLPFLRREVVGVSPARMFAAIAATAPMATDSICAMDLWDILPGCNSNYRRWVFRGSHCCFQLF